MILVFFLGKEGTDISRKEMLNIQNQRWNIVVVLFMTAKYDHFKVNWKSQQAKLYVRTMANVIKQEVKRN